MGARSQGRAGRVVAVAVFLTAAIAAGLVLRPSHEQTSPAGQPLPTDLVHRSTFSEAFGLLQTVRELPDGRLLVADPLGRILAAIDLETGATEPVGREGGGPGEWRQPDAVYPLPGDSSLLVDLENTRLSVLDPDGNFVRGYPMALLPTGPASGGEAGPGTASGSAAGTRAAGARTSRTGSPGGQMAGAMARAQSPGGALAVQILHPRATDALGRVYYQARPRGIPGAATGEVADSSEVRRWGMNDEPPVRLAGLRPPALASAGSGGPGQGMVSMRPMPLAHQDDWAVASDGSVAVVRAEPYRVEWLRPDGSVAVGPPVHYEPVPVSTAEKERWLEAVSAGITMMISVSGGATDVQVGRGRSGMVPASAQGGLDDYEWPALLPPFRSGGARVDDVGRLWVERYSQVGDPVVYDIFNEHGERISRARLPRDRRIIGFGDGVAFVVHVDDLGLNRLEVYELPAPQPTGTGQTQRKPGAGRGAVPRALPPSLEGALARQG